MSGLYCKIKDFIAYKCMEAVLYLISFSYISVHLILIFLENYNL